MKKIYNVHIPKRPDILARVYGSGVILDACSTVIDIKQSIIRYETTYNNNKLPSSKIHTVF